MIDVATMQHKLTPYRGALLVSALAALLLAASAHAEQTPEIEVRVEPEEIFSGESVTYQVVLKNTANDARPDLSALNENFTVTPLGGPAQSTRMFVSGRKRFQESTLTWHYKLTPKKTGLLTIPGPKATSNGTAIAGADLKLNVQAPQKQDIALLEIVARDRVYREPFDVTLRVLIKPLPDGSKRDPLSVLRDNPALQFEWTTAPDGLAADSEISNWLEKFVTQSGTGFTINNVTVSHRQGAFAFFEEQRPAVFSLYTGRETRKGLDGTDIEYYVYEIKRTFTPQRTGTFTFGPASLKGTFAAEKTANAITGRRLVVTAEAKTVTVADAPAPSPPNFSGAIGKFTVDASATPTALRVGDPLTFSIRFSRLPGSGLLDLVSAPDLSLSKELVDAFDIIDKTATGEVKGDSKTFSYGLRPKRAGVSLPAVNVAIFDTAAEKYIDLATPAIPLKVTAATQLRPDELVSATPAAQPQGLKNLGQGIFQNVTDISVLADQSVQPVNFLAASGLLGMIYVLASVFISRGRRLAQDPAWQRRQRAQGELDGALNAARAALSAGKDAEAARGVRGAVVGLIANMLNLPAAGMTAQEAGAALERHNASGDVRKQTTDLLEALEALEYSSAAGASTARLFASAEELLPKLHRELEARR